MSYSCDRGKAISIIKEGAALTFLAVITAPSVRLGWEGGDLACQGLGSWKQSE